MGKYFGCIARVVPYEKTAYVNVRAFGIDIDVAVYGYINDWVFPIMLIPKRWGYFVMVLGVSLFVGRLSGSE